MIESSTVAMHTVWFVSTGPIVDSFGWLDCPLNRDPPVCPCGAESARFNTSICSFGWLDPRGIGAIPTAASTCSSSSSDDESVSFALASLRARWYALRVVGLKCLAGSQVHSKIGTAVRISPGLTLAFVRNHTLRTPLPVTFLEPNSTPSPPKILWLFLGLSLLPLLQGYDHREEEYCFFSGKQRELSKNSRGAVYKPNI